MNVKVFYGWQMRTTEGSLARAVPGRGRARKCRIRAVVRVWRRTMKGRVWRTGAKRCARLGRRCCLAPVGAKLAREDGGSVTVMLNVPPPSQASQLPQEERAYTKSVYDTNPVGAGLPAITVGQSQGYWMCRRHRGQARSHRRSGHIQNLCTTQNLWERACPR